MLKLKYMHGTFLYHTMHHSVHFSDRYQFLHGGGLKIPKTLAPSLDTPCCVSLIITHCSHYVITSNLYQRLYMHAPSISIFPVATGVVELVYIAEYIASMQCMVFPTSIYIAVNL